MTDDALMAHLIVDAAAIKNSTDFILKMNGKFHSAECVNGYLAVLEALNNHSHEKCYLLATDNNYCSIVSGRVVLWRPTDIPHKIVCEYVSEMGYSSNEFPEGIYPVDLSYIQTYYKCEPQQAALINILMAITGRSFDYCRNMSDKYKEFESRMLLYTFQPELRGEIMEEIATTVKEREITKQED